MTATGPSLIRLEAYKAHTLPADSLPLSVGELIWKQHGNHVEVNFPTPKTGNLWELTARDFVGFLPISPAFTLVLLPKTNVSLGNVFGMLEYAYRLEFLKKDAPDELIGCANFEDFYTRLAHVLAKRVLDRERKGLYRSYVSREEPLRCVRGRIDVQRMVRRPGIVDLDCEFEEHTADIEDNQILEWTLRGILQNVLCTERIRPTMREAWRRLQGLGALKPLRPRVCLNRRYNRLNADYEPLHCLCRFFLDHTGPSHVSGGYAMLPFLVNMARLFEMFVEEWLTRKLRELAPRYFLRPHFRFDFGKTREITFDIDLLLCERVAEQATERVVCVLDTKYKKANSPSPDDVQQIVAYAALQGCRKAVLVYPVLSAAPLDGARQGIHVRSLAFDLSSDLEAAGQALLEDLIGFVAGE